MLPETGEFYHGSRSCKCLPENDKYKGSMYTWKPDKTKLVKTIVKLFDSRDDALLFERELIIKDIEHPLNRNYAIPSINWCTQGKVVVRNSSNKTFMVSCNDPLYLNKTFVPFQIGENNGMFGKTLYKIWIKKYGKNEADIRLEEFCKNVSNALKGRDNRGEKNPMFGKKHSPESIQKNKDSQPYNSENFPQWLKDIISEKTRGEKNPMFGKTFYDVWVDEFGKEEADRRLIEYKQNKTGRVWYHNDELNKQKQLKPEEIEKYVNEGWIKGKFKLKKK